VGCHHGNGIWQLHDGRRFTFPNHGPFIQQNNLMAQIAAELKHSPKWGLLATANAGILEIINLASCNEYFAAEIGSKHKKFLSTSPRRHKDVRKAATSTLQAWNDVKVALRKHKILVIGGNKK
jgi:hypothetical protein